MTFLLTCIIPGTPQQQGSKRSLGAGRPFIEANRNLAPWRADAIAYLQAEWRGRGPITEPVSLDVAFDFARPASHYGTGRNAGVLKDSAPGCKATAPDLDKLTELLIRFTLQDSGEQRATRAREHRAMAGVSDPS